jgi:1,4-alpha-glucan branching enzyme
MRYAPPTADMREDFHQGRSRDAFRFLGAHPGLDGDREVWHFAVWAPNALSVGLVGAFNGWDREKHPMEKQYDGTWELRLPRDLFSAGEPYKYAIRGADGAWHLKADPYAFFSELRPNTASRLYDMGGYPWQDEGWMEKRGQWNAFASPVNIYEMHLGSWRRGEDGRLLSYSEIADQLIPYILEMGYTHIELLPVMEHPLDMSWGYQITGYFAVTARFGEPREFMAFVDRCHQANIGVILDWAPAHFPRDEAGLRRFDGTACYEHPDPRRGEMPQWGTHMFDFARGETCSFLLSSACFWMEMFHADGLRVDAVSSMLYYDFCREPGQWLPNQYGGRENLDAIAFLRRLNETVYRDFPGAVMIAEESSAYPMVTRPTYLGGLGFGFKWNMGWMNDILSYVALDPIFRKWHHDKLTFSLFYAFSENYILPFSHDEVVHGKHSLLDKHPGDIWQKFAGLRALYGYTMAHPGKKLLFMGSEFAHFIEWKYDDQLDWFLLVYERHPQVKECVRALNHLYRATPALYEVEDGWAGFQWLSEGDSDNSVIAFTRTDKKGNTVCCVVNFTPVFHPIYRVGLPVDGTLTELFNTDRAEFGGSNQYNAWPIPAQDISWNGLEYSVEVCVPPLSCVYFTYEKREPPKKRKAARKTSRKDGTEKEGTSAKHSRGDQ